MRYFNMLNTTHICAHYRFGKHYEFPLLLQSILMIIAMFVMIKLCINIQNGTQIIKAKERVFTGEASFNITASKSIVHNMCNVICVLTRTIFFIDLDVRFFWKWTNFQSYLTFMVLFATVASVLTYLFVDIPIFIEIVGLLAVLIEAMLGIPQFLRNSSNKSTAGMR